MYKNLSVMETEDSYTSFTFIPEIQQSVCDVIPENLCKNNVRSNAIACAPMYIGKNARKKPHVKYKVNYSVNMGKTKQKQLNIKNYVTRLKKRKNLIDQEVDLYYKNSADGLLTSHFCGKDNSLQVSDFNNSAMKDPISFCPKLRIMNPVELSQSFESSVKGDAEFSNVANCTVRGSECTSKNGLSMEGTLYELINITVDPGCSAKRNVGNAAKFISPRKNSSFLDKVEILKEPQQNYHKSVAVNSECEVTSKVMSNDGSEQSFTSLPDLDWERIENEALTYASTSSYFCNEELSNTKRPEIIDDITYEVAAINRNLSEKEVKLYLSNPSESGGTINKRCILRGFWTQSLINKGDCVRVLAPFVDDCAIIDDTSGFLVVHPDFLISSTAVVSTLFCPRKAVLSQKFHCWNGTNKIMMIGKFVHQLFQQVLSDQCSSEEEIEDVLQRILKRSQNIMEMYYQDVYESEIRSELLSFVPSISEWMKLHCTFNEESSLSNDIQVSEVRDIEDNVWCLRYGIKGKIDLTVKVNIQGENLPKLMPLELKTGAASYSPQHEGQVHIYSLMMEDRTQEFTGGLLLYLRERPEMRLISSNHSILRGLIQLRNELAHYTYRLNDVMGSARQNHTGNCHLPKPINNKVLCQKCPYLLPCTVYQKAFGENPSPSHAMSYLVPNSTKHLTEDHLDFFCYWSRLLYLESASPQLSAFWNEDAESREMSGLCFSNMVLRKGTQAQQQREGAVHIHTFFRSKDSPIISDLASVGIKPGDYVTISNQRSKFELALDEGYVVHVGDHFVHVSLQRDIQKLTRYEGYLFRLDKRIPNFSKPIGFGNLMKLMLCNDRSSRLRELIIEKKPPEFQATMSKRLAFIARPFLSCLNKSQRKAIFKALMAKDYMLLKGMPGTGKTATIVALIRFLVKLGKTVLLTSHTHSAVDNVLLKLHQCNVDFLRLGHLSKIHATIQPFAFEVVTKDITEVRQLHELLKSKMVMATTCLSINQEILQKFQYDVCIVDECSQIALLTSLGPLYCAKKFILVGDPKQLPPVVNSDDKDEIPALQQTLFSYLENSENCMELALQYRMNREIMRLCNYLTYDGVMKCGSEEIESATLPTTELPCMKVSSSQHHWLSIALDNHLKNSALFLNTDGVPAIESHDSQNRIQNCVENQLVCLIVKHLLKAGLSFLDIGVISPYRCQVELIKDTLVKENDIPIEISTVDQYQGRDKEVIIISCVRNNYNIAAESWAVSSIVGDERRLNVALSRAKKKLLIIGSKPTLMHFDCFKSLFSIFRGDQIIDLPKSAHEIICDSLFN